MPAGSVQAMLCCAVLSVRGCQPVSLHRFPAAWQPPPPPLHCAPRLLDCGMSDRRPTGDICVWKKMVWRGATDVSWRCTASRRSGAAPGQRGKDTNMQRQVKERALAGEPALL